MKGAKDESSRPEGPQPRSLVLYTFTLLYFFTDMAIDFNDGI